MSGNVSCKICGNVVFRRAERLQEMSVNNYCNKTTLVEETAAEQKICAVHSAPGSPHTSQKTSNAVTEPIDVQ